MQLKRIDSRETIDTILERWFIKNTATNNYLLLESYENLIKWKKLFYVNSESNCAILVEKDGFYRLYYFLNDFMDPLKIEVDFPVVMEIIYRGYFKYPEQEINYWLNLGFKIHLTRDNLFSIYDSISLSEPIDNEIEIEYVHGAREEEFTMEIIDKTLDKYTGDILSLKEIRRFSENKWILIAYYDRKPAGILQFEIKNNVVWLGHLCVDISFRGKGIARALVHKFIVDNFTSVPTRYQLWVINDNKSAISLYSKFGFKYANKTSTSLLKI